jgi:hypothetical protein
MRSLDSLDDEIRETERRLALRRLELTAHLQSTRVRARRSLTSPGMLIGAVVAGFLIERLGRLRPARPAHAESAEAVKRTGIAGLAAGIGAAAVRAALSNPQLWHSAREMWARRSASRYDRYESADLKYRYESEALSPYPDPAGK